jgi:hypothetical protein
VLAVQEYDHERANLIEEFVLKLGNIYNKDNKKKHSYLKMATDLLYELDDKIATEFFKPTKSLSDVQGSILAELCEIRALINCAINTNEEIKTP